MRNPYEPHQKGNEKGTWSFESWRRIVRFGKGKEWVHG
jgi:hypothetical protein